MAGSSRSLGVLTLDLILKAGGFTAGLDKAARDTDKRMSDIERRAYKFGQALGTALKVGAGLAATAVGALSVAVGKAINNADALRDISVRLGVGAETLSAYAYAAQQAGTDIDSLGKGLKFLQKNMAEALDPKSSQANLFKSLGIDIKDAQGNLKDIEEVLPDIATAFKTLDNDATETALSMQLFGKSGSDLLEFLNLGADGLDQMAQKAKDLGIILSDETLTAADNFNDAVADLKAATQGLTTQIAAALLPTLTSLTQGMVDFVKDGNNAKDVAQDLSTTFEFLGGVAKFVGGYIKAIGDLAEGAGMGFVGLTESAKGFINLDWDQIKRGFRVAQEGADLSYFGEDKASKRNPGAYGNNTSPTVDPIAARIKLEFKSLDQQAKDIVEAQKKRDALQKLVNDYLGNPTGKTPKTTKTKSGKSDAEREAEKVAKAIRQMTDAQKDFEVQLNDNGNPIAKEYAQNLADIADNAEKFAQDGVPAEKIAAFVEKMKELATSIQSKELAEFQKEFTDDTLALAAATEGPGAAGMLAYSQAVEELDKQLKNGLISQEQYNDRVEAMVTPFEEVTAALAMQAEALTRTAEQQEIYNQQKLAGVEAMSEEGLAIEEMIKANGRLAESYGFVNDAKTDLADAFTDFVTGAKSAKEAFGDFADSIYKRAIQLLADKAVEALFKAFSGAGASSTGTGSTGGWAELFGSLFGGARAMGGGVNSGQMYRVNENGPEMLSVGSRDYLMMGSQSGRVTPSHMVGSGGGNTTIINVQPTTTRRTADQIAQANERKQRTATLRNG